MADIIQRTKLRRGTAAAWTAANPILLAGEEGYETDTRKRKVGNGTSTWTALAYEGATTGGPLAVTSYRPATGVSTAATTTSAVAVDATNLTVTFTVPASGRVLVGLNSYVYTGTNTALSWCLMQGASAIAGDVGIVSYDTSDQYLRATKRGLIAGLTPGATVTLTWGHLRPFGTANAETRYGGDSHGEAFMEVWAA